MVSSIHNYQRRLDSVLKRLENDNEVIPQNRDDILRFNRRLTAEGISAGRRFKYCWSLWKLSNWLGKDFKKATKDDIIDLVARIQSMKSNKGKPYSLNSIQDFNVSLKRFYRFLYELPSGEYPDQVKWLKLTHKKRDEKLPEELLTEEEVKKLAKYAGNTRDRALILLLYESGCRVSEILTLKLRNIQSTDYGISIKVEGKTGQRVVPIVSSEPEVGKWLNEHPLNGDPDAFLFISISDKSKYDNKPLAYVACNHLLKRSARRAGIKKKVNPHNLRHARATHLANQMTEQQLKQMFGWTQDSRVASTYVHLSGRDIEEAVLKASGIETKKKLKPKFGVRMCPRCHQKNSTIAKYCSNCSQLLDTELSEMKEKLENDITSILMKIVQRKLEEDPKFAEEVEAMFRKDGLFVDFRNYLDKRGVNYEIVQGYDFRNAVLETTNKMRELFDEMQEISKKFNELETSGMHPTEKEKVENKLKSDIDSIRAEIKEMKEHNNDFIEGYKKIRKAYG